VPGRPGSGRAESALRSRGSVPGGRAAGGGRPQIPTLATAGLGSNAREPDIASKSRVIAAAGRRRETESFVSSPAAVPNTYSKHSDCGAPQHTRHMSGAPAKTSRGAEAGQRRLAKPVCGNREQRARGPGQTPRSNSRPLRARGASKHLPAFDAPHGCFAIWMGLELTNGWATTEASPRPRRTSALPEARYWRQPPRSRRAGRDLPA
jgi:hypothetical protein